MNILNPFCKSCSPSIIIIITLLHTRGILADIFDDISADIKSPGVGLVKISGTNSERLYNITKCNPEVSNAINGQVIKIVPYKNCINIYQEPNCRGHFVRYMPGPYGILRSPEGHKWVGDTLVKTPLLVHSVGPCYDRCDPRNWDGALGKSPTVTFYDRSDFRGNQATVHLNSDDCYVLPKSPSRRYWQSLKISGDESSSCVELHKLASCGGEFTQLRPGYPNLYELGGYGYRAEYSIYRTKAVSRCGTFCGKTITPVKPLEPLENPGHGFVTFYDDYGYYGNAINLNLTGGCVGVDFDTGDDTRSVRTYGQCVIFYGLSGCEERQGYNTLQLGGGLENDYYLDKFLTLTIPMSPKSLGLCPSVLLVDDKVTKEEPSPTVGLPPEMDQNCVELEKVKILEKMLADAANKGFPDWIIYVQPLFYVLFFVGGAFLGGLIVSKRYEKRSPGVISEKTNVAFKS